LLGRGRPFQEHAGNLKCNYVVVAAMEKYEEASRNDKTNIAKDVIATIKAYGERFLKQSDGVWQVVDDAEALQKISHSFRTHHQLLKAQQSSGKSSDNLNETTKEVNNQHKRSREE
jgi:hypothetical protein